MARGRLRFGLVGLALILLSSPLVLAEPAAPQASPGPAGMPGPEGVVDSMETPTLDGGLPSVEEATQAQPVSTPIPPRPERIVDDAKNRVLDAASDATREGTGLVKEVTGLEVSIMGHTDMGDRLPGTEPTTSGGPPHSVNPTDPGPIVVVDPAPLVEGVPESGEPWTIEIDAGQAGLPHWLPHGEESSSASHPEYAPTAATGAKLEEPGALAVLVGAGITTALVLALPLRILLASLFSRIRRPKLLDQAGRNQAFEAVRAAPWSSLPELRRATGLSRSSLRHHLAVLRRHGLVRTQRHGRALRYAEIALGVPTAFEPEAERHVRSLLQAGPQPMAAAMRKLCESFGYSRYGAWKVVQRLAKSGSASLERRGARFWLTTPDGRGAPGMSGAASPPVAGSP